MLSTKPTSQCLVVILAYTYFKPKNPTPLPPSFCCIYPARSCPQTLSQSADFLPFLLCHNILEARRSERSHPPPKCSLCTCARLCSTQWTPCCSRSASRFCPWRRTPPRSKQAGCTPRHRGWSPPKNQTPRGILVHPCQCYCANLDTPKDTGAPRELHHCVVLLLRAAPLFSQPVAQVAAPKDLKKFISRLFIFPSSSLLAPLL